jgi:2-polyprenyl-3-methyl-5-hydroxy-6-metoxy-1,4-benzoquinol methylase
MSHLDYYLRHGISPVHYDLSSLEAHLERRGSLYRSLGLIPLALRRSKILEVAAGTGQNSLYLAVQEPAELTLLEPNPAGARQIETLYTDQPLRHTSPQLIRKKLEDYEPQAPFDIVICENWLGRSAHERALLRKLCGFLAPQGVLVVTVVSPIGFLPNMLRRAMSARLIRSEQSFDEQTQTLVRAFGGHLATMKAMTRTAVDWVHDNMLTPVYFDICLPIPAMLAEVGEGFEVLGSSPQFAQDWRWFKALHGEQRRFNAHFTEEYFAHCHNLVDYRLALPRGDAAANRAMEEAAFQFIDEVRDFEAQLRGPAARGEQAMSALNASVDRFIALARGVLPQSVIDALGEAASLLRRPELDETAVAAAEKFAGLFGRETLYVSMQRVAE